MPFVPLACKIHRTASKAATLSQKNLPDEIDKRTLEPFNGTAGEPSSTKSTHVRPRCVPTSEADGGGRRQKRRPRATHPLPIPKHPPTSLKTAFARQAIARAVWKLPRERPRHRKRRAIPPMQRMARAVERMLGVMGGGSSHQVGPPRPKATTQRGQTANQAPAYLMPVSPVPAQNSRVPLSSCAVLRYRYATDQGSKGYWADCGIVAEYWCVMLACGVLTVHRATDCGAVAEH